VYEIPEGAKATGGSCDSEPAEHPERKIRCGRTLSYANWMMRSLSTTTTSSSAPNAARSKKRCSKNIPRPRQGGINAIGINEGDALIEAKLTNGKNEIILAITKWQSHSF
jgi:DNA gyrase subunit A